ncbi:ankyrin repeat-containing domain protein [Russula brevipes]|nr:ankyrin repeat-containing domain protein [Russula brevipes]
MAQLLSILARSTKAMTDGRIRNVARRLLGRKDIEDELSRLDTLTKEENLVVVAKSLELLYKSQRDQLRRDFRTWLSPPSPSVNHNTACKSRHSGTCKWFIEGSTGTFREWKKNGSLLWVRGNPGAGKSVLCSAIIEDIKNMRKVTPTSMAYYYFDYKDASKRDIRGLLASLLFQLGDSSDRCWDALYELFKTCRDGSEQPSEVALADCLKSMLELPGQLPIFIIMDALDECPSTGLPSAREEVLDFVEDLVESNYSNLFICITSRPESDIQAVLDPLTSTSYRVSLHEESEQREDINSYVESFVRKDRAMRKWREEDKILVISSLSERGGGMFQWVVCQLDTLRQCFPSSICMTLYELPTSLDETYEQTLQGIPKEKRQYAHRLFQCLIAAIRPLRVEELAEVFTIEFNADTMLNLKENWRPENPEEAVLSACSTIISVIEYEGSKIVQFSHFSVKEFLTSDRLRSSEDTNIRHYYGPLDSAHGILARACLAVLLQLDDQVDKKRLATFPLAFYAAEHWVNHVKYGDVASRVQRAVEQLFDPSKSHLAAWIWIHDIDWHGDVRSIEELPEQPPSPEATALYYAALCGLGGLAKHLIIAHAEDVNASCGRRGTPLHAAVYMGHLDAARVLLDHGADVNRNLGDRHRRRRAPLAIAHRRGNLEAMRLLLEYGADVNAQYDDAGSVLDDASFEGETEVVQLLLQHKADVNINASSTSRDKSAPLHWASIRGHSTVARLLLEHNADVNALTAASHCTPLYSASIRGHLEFVRVLLSHGADVHIREETDQTPLQAAKRNGHGEVVRLLVEHGAENEQEGL